MSKKSSDIETGNAEDILLQLDELAEEATMAALDASLEILSAREQFKNAKLGEVTKIALKARAISTHVSDQTRDLAAVLQDMSNKS